MTLEMLLLCGFVAGLLIGFAIPHQKLGCIALFVVPIAAIVDVARWQKAHPENLTSTSALDFIFGPLWPSCSAIVGFVVGRKLRSALIKR